MGLDISGTAKTAGRAKEALLRIAEYFDEHFGDDLVGEPNIIEDGRGLLVSFSTTSEPIAFEAVDGATIEVQCRWNQLGPGYCVFVWERLRELAELGLTWEELDGETEEDELTHEGAIRAARAWLEALCSGVLQDSPEDMSGTRLCMPMHWAPHDVPFAITPLGPRDRAWVESVAEDGSAGDDFFAWWQPDLGPATKLQLAIATMWSNVPWSPPAVEDDFVAIGTALEWLERGYDENGGLPYPWPEWSEMISNFNSALDEIPGDHERPRMAEMVHDRASGRAGTIGYRRGSIEHMIGGGWSLTLPGSFGTALEEDEDHSAWLASDGSMTIRVSPALAPDDMPGTKEEFAEATAEEEDPGVEWESDTCIGRGDWGEQDEEGQTVLMLQGISMADNRSVAFVSIMFGDPEFRERAMEIWQSLRCEAAFGAA